MDIQWANTAQGRLDQLNQQIALCPGQFVLVQAAEEPRGQHFRNIMRQRALGILTGEPIRIDGDDDCQWRIPTKKHACPQPNNYYHGCQVHEGDIVPATFFDLWGFFSPITSVDNHIEVSEGPGCFGGGFYDRDLRLQIVIGDDNVAAWYEPTSRAKHDSITADELWLMAKTLGRPVAQTTAMQFYLDLRREKVRKALHNTTERLRRGQEETASAQSDLDRLKAVAEFLEA